MGGAAHDMDQGEEVRDTVFCHTGPHRGTVGQAVNTRDRYASDLEFPPGQKER